jgi:hypothetical protein
MQVAPGLPGGDSAQSNSSKSTPSTTSGQSGHSIFVNIAGSVIGVSILAIIADFSDNAGGFAVALMAGWFLIFLMTNATELTKGVQFL